MLFHSLPKDNRCLQRANAGEIYKWQQNMLSRVLFYANDFKVIVYLHKANSILQKDDSGR